MVFRNTFPIIGIYSHSWLLGKKTIFTNVTRIKQKEIYLKHDTISFMDFTRIIMGSYEMFLIDNPLNHNQYTNPNQPYCPLHKYHIAMVIYSSKCI